MATVTVAKLRKLKNDFIDRQQDGLKSEAQKLQDALYEVVVERFIDLFATDDGKIIFNDENLNASNAIEKIIEQYNKTQFLGYLTKFVSDIQYITDLSIKYHKSMADSLKKFAGVEQRVTDLMYLRLGINDKGQFSKDGYMDRYLKDTGLKNEVKNKIVQGISKQLSTRDLLRTVKENIKGTEPDKGLIVKRFKTTLFDVYSQYDRATSKVFADELSLKAFIYSGGLINDSRAFCVDKNDKVFTIAEAEEWKNDPLLPRTKNERKTGVLIGYDPLINMGRWMGNSESCRHHPNFISNAEAIKRRPDLEGKL